MLLQWSPKRKLAAGFGLVLAFLLVNTAISFHNLRRVVDNNIRVTHTHEVLSELQSVLSTVKDIESGQRGYVITGAEPYLEPYNAAVMAVQGHLQRLRTLIIDPEVRKDLPVLERNIRDRLATSKQVVEARRAAGIEAASGLMRSGLGRSEMDDLRDTVKLMTKAETGLLRQRQAESQASIRNALLTVAITSLVSLGLLVMVYYMIRRGEAQRERVAADLTAIETFSENIVDTVREPLLTLDSTLRVHSANRAFYQTFQVSAAETENRLIYELGNGQWDIPALRRLLEDVVPKSSVFNDFELEHTFPVIGRRVMLLNARKLEAGNHGELLVLAMEDVTERRRAEEEVATAAADVKAIETFSQNIVDTVREPLLTLDSTLRVRSANRAFYQTFQVSAEETEKHLIYELGNGQWDIPDLRRLLEDVVPKSSVFNDFELVHTFPVIGRRVMLLNARKLKAGQHGDLLVLAMEDVTERRRAEEEVAKAAADLKDIETFSQNIVDTVREPLLMLDTTLRVHSANRAFYQTFQVSAEETEDRLIYELGNGQWDIPVLRTLLEDVVPQSSAFNDFELEHTFPIIGRRVMLLNARQLKAGNHGELLVLAMEDVTERRRAEEALLKAGALQSAIFNSANFSSIATDAKGVIQIFNVGAERMLGYTAAEVMNKITPADISDPEEVIARAKALSVELGTP
ncbi:MAG TPA: CHASE3 domain-containing protein, partial [Abditibacteriaceae bacterium]|nr:CHASE3 domain-containing protein [Abditibacteriaceae bacterium]